jgi:hypothetical protein
VKGRSDSETDGSELASKVAAWLEEQGYPVELGVGRVFQTLGWHVDHRKWFRDPISGAMREIDLVASRFAATADDTRSVSWDLVVECKRSRDKPWVALSSSIPERLSDVRYAAGETGPDVHLVASAYGVAAPSILQPPFQRAAHGLVTALIKPKDGDPTSAYSAVRAVTTAARAVDKENADLSLMMPTRPTMTVTVPFVVLDGPLFEYYLESFSGKPVLRPADYVTAVHPGMDGWLYHVTIVDLRFLAGIVETLTSQVDRFLADLVPHAEDILLSYRSRMARVPSASGTGTV